jgi:hypothetical protein
MYVTILGKQYQIKWVTYLGKAKRGYYVAGKCDDPTQQKKAIRIKKGQDPKTEFDATIHECLHAAAWWAAEEWVTDTATDLTEILWRLGYRKLEGVDGKATK